MVSVIDAVAAPLQGTFRVVLLRLLEQVLVVNLTGMVPAPLEGKFQPCYWYRQVVVLRLLEL